MADWSVLYSLIIGFKGHQEALRIGRVHGGPQGIVQDCLRRAHRSGPEKVSVPTGVVKSCRLCLLCAKGTRRNWDSAVPDLLPDVWKQQLAVLRERATQMLQLGGVSILLLFQVP
jgi:hypothetical protein